MGVAMRHERISYLNIGTHAAQNFKIMGEGFTDMTDSRNPEVDETQYISDEAKTKTITSYGPEWSFEGDVIKDDAVIEFIRGIGADLKTGADAEAELVEFDAWEVAIDGTVAAKLFAVAVQVDSIATGAGGEKLGFAGSLLGKGDPVDGVWDTADNSFTPDVS